MPSPYGTSSIDAEHGRKLLDKHPYVDDESNADCYQPSVKELDRRQRRTAFSYARVIVPYALSVIFLVLYLIERLKKPTLQDPSMGIYSPARSAIKYETKVFAENFVTKGPYMGQEVDGIPNAETDRLWEDLYQYGINQISASEAAQLPNRTTAIPTKPDQFVIELDVFHQLHCLNAIRKTLYPERYWDEFDDYYLPGVDEMGRTRRNYTSTDAKHYDHCIDSIRQSIMCHGDIATVYWQWMPVRRQPLPRLEITHTCRDFNALKDWAKDHQLLDDEQVLQWRPAEESSFVLSGSS